MKGQTPIIKISPLVREVNPHNHLNSKFDYSESLDTSDGLTKPSVNRILI
jgi:hypothetical protein